MYSVRCPQCGREYRDSNNGVSIMLTTLCLSCRADNIKQIEDWEGEGGPIQNDTC